ncbi:MAG: PKD domain-containing protein [Nitrospiraceae bacterium]|nr:PKD domain-containing protein [Nitrospiraceae bacterium]
MIIKGSSAFLALGIAFGLFMTFFIPMSIADTNQPPHADFYWTPSSGIKTGDTVTFHDNSTDDGTIIAWEWDFGDGNYSIIQNPTHVYYNNGRYDVTLRVIDNNGSNDSVTKQITILNRPPVADAGPDQVVNVTLVSFDGSGSSDMDGTIVTYRWNFGDGKTGTGETTTHNYSSDGKYVVTLNVTDNDGASDEDTCNVTVDTVAPVTNISFNGTEGNNGWYTSNVTVTILPSDATSGVDTTYYSINGGNWTNYTSPFIISDNGETAIEFYSIDKAGNKEAVENSTIKIEKTAPNVSINKPKEGYFYFFGRQLFPTVRDKTIVLGRITVEVTVTSTPSGINFVRFYVDGTVKYNDTESPYTWMWGMSLGRHTLKVEAVDMAGHNASKEMEVTIFSILPGRNNNLYAEENPDFIAS